MARTKRKVTPPDTIWEIPDNLWPIIEKLLAEHYPPAPTGRPRADFRRIINGIIFRLRSSCQWNHLPKEFGSDSTVHRWFQRFNADGLFEKLWALLVASCDELDGVSWEWQSADTVLNKARFGGTSPAKTPRIAAKPARNAGFSSRRRADRSPPSWRRRTRTTAR